MLKEEKGGQLHEPPTKTINFEHEEQISEESHRRQFYMLQLTQVLVVELKAFPLEHSQLLLVSVIPEEQLSQIFSETQVTQLGITHRTQDPALYDVKAGHPQDPLESTRFE